MKNHACQIRLPLKRQVLSTITNTKMFPNKFQISHKTVIIVIAWALSAPTPWPPGGNRVNVKVVLIFLSYFRCSLLTPVVILLPQFTHFRFLSGNSWWGRIWPFWCQSSLMSSLSFLVKCGRAPAVTIFLIFWNVDPIIYNILLVMATRFLLWVHLGIHCKRFNKWNYSWLNTVVFI